MKSAASDAWPLMGVKDFDEFNSRLLAGPPVVTPRLTDVPVRMPLPPAKRQGSICETQSRVEEILLHARRLKTTTMPAATPRALLLSRA